jgi:hypothetical protein
MLAGNLHPHLPNVVKDSRKGCKIAPNRALAVSVQPKRSVCYRVDFNLMKEFTSEILF